MFDPENLVSVKEDEAVSGLMADLLCNLKINWNFKGQEEAQVFLWL